MQPLNLTFQKSFTINDIINITSLNVEQRGYYYYIVDKYDNAVRLKFNSSYKKDNNTPILSVTINDLNNSYYILDTIVDVFQTTFITDIEKERLFYNLNLNVQEIYNDTTRNFGYNVTNSNNYIIVLKRKYVINKSNFNEFISRQERAEEHFIKYPYINYYIEYNDNYEKCYHFKRNGDWKVTRKYEGKGVYYYKYKNFIN